MDAGGRRADADDEAQAQADLGEVRGRDRGALRGLTASDSSATTLEVGRRVWLSFNEGDLEGFYGSLAPDCVMATDRRWPGGGEFRGREEIERFLAQFLEAFGRIRFVETHEPEIVGDWGHYQGKWVGLGHTSGIETVSFEFSMIFRVSDGAIAESRFFFDSDEAREYARSRT